MTKPRVVECCREQSNYVQLPLLPFVPCILIYKDEFLKQEQTTLYKRRAINVDPDESLRRWEI